MTILKFGASNFKLNLNLNVCPPGLVLEVAHVMPVTGAQRQTTPQALLISGAVMNAREIG